MIKIILIIAVIVLLWLGIPLLIEMVRRSRQRRAEAREARHAEEEKQKQAAIAERERIDRLWREEPDKAGMAEQLRYRDAVQMGLKHEVLEAQQVHNQRVNHAEQRVSEHRGGKPVTAIYKVIVLAGLVAFLFVSLLALALDYLIFRGLHPTGTVLLPAGLACLAVLGITVGSIVFMNSRRHGLLAEGTTSYTHNVVALGGVLLAAGIATYMIAIAPNRSIPAGEVRINTATQVLDQAETAVPASAPLLITQDQQNLALAKSSLAHAEVVDRLSAGALALIEIPLSEAAVLGSGVLALELALLRRERARRAQRHAENRLERADGRFTAELVGILVAHGHGEEVFPKIHKRLAALAGDPNSAPKGIAGAPQPANPPGPQPTSPPGPTGGQPTMPNPPTTGGPAHPNPPTVGAPAQPNPPGPRPPITVIPPVGTPTNGPATGGPHSTNGGPTATVPAQVLSPTEFDETA
jgi:hypothetical protein